MSWNNILLKGPGPTDWILKLDLRSIDSQREINEKPIWRLINPFTLSHSVQSTMINLDLRRRFKASTILSNEKLGFKASKRNGLLSNVRSLRIRMLHHHLCFVPLDHDQLCNQQGECITRRIMFLKYAYFWNMILLVMYSTFGLHNFLLISYSTVHSSSLSRTK